MENKTITITEEQFTKAMMEADRKMVSGLHKVGNMPSDVEFGIRLQNMTYGMELQKILFAENKGEE